MTRPPWLVRLSMEKNKKGKEGTHGDDNGLRRKEHVRTLSYPHVEKSRV